MLTDVAEKMVLPQNEDGSKAKGNAAGGQQARLGASSHPPSIAGLGCAEGGRTPRVGTDGLTENVLFSLEIKCLF